MFLQSYIYFYNVNSKIRLLGESPTWHMDGTFKTCPDPFNQECASVKYIYLFLIAIFKGLFYNARKSGNGCGQPGIFFSQLYVIQALWGSINFIFVEMIFVKGQ
jgi:hypothetical protein